LGEIGIAFDASQAIQSDLNKILPCFPQCSRHSLIVKLQSTINNGQRCWLSLCVLLSYLSL